MITNTVSRHIQFWEKTKSITNFEMKPLRIQTSNFYVTTVSVLLFSFLTSCEEPGLFRKPKWIGVISNETEYQISISAYSRKVKEDSFYINPGEKLSREFTERELGFTKGLFYLPEGLDVNNKLIDSVVIIFEGKRKIVQFCGGGSLGNCDNIPNNLVNLWEKRNQILDKGGNLLFGYLYKYEISLTKDDYNSAVPF